MKFIYYPKCSTCLKAKRFLDSHNLEYEIQDIKLNTPTFFELKDILSKSNLSISKFINTSGLVYKELHLKDKLSTMSEDDILKLLASNGMLIKRPILVTDNKVLVGFKEEVYKTLFN